jgi:predicted GNAT family acetyltransferase
VRDEVIVNASADVEEYAAHVTPFLEREAVERNVLLTVIEQARQRWPAWTAPPHFWWITAGDDVVAAASWTPPFALLVSSMPAEAVASLSEAAVERAEALGIDLPGVSGPTDASRALADAIAARSGCRVVEHMRMVVHELPAIVEVPRPPGAARPASPEDAPLVIEWIRAFASEAHAPIGGDVDASVRASIDARRIWLWVDGHPRSTASQQPAVGGAARIGGVYTPPAERGRGYARRLVHDISAAALRAPGVRACTLNTDATNPVSNSIYRQIGYVAVAEHAQFALVR